MKKRAGIALVAVATAVLIAGCRTTEPIWFIATPGYVEAQIAMREEAIRQEYEGRIRDLESEVDEQRAVADELASLAGVITEVERSNRELHELASRVEGEIADLPYETIQIIVDVLTRHLEGNR